MRDHLEKLTCAGMDAGDFAFSPRWRPSKGPCLLCRPSPRGRSDIQVIGRTSKHSSAPGKHGLGAEPDVNFCLHTYVCTRR